MNQNMKREQVLFHVARALVKFCSEKAITLAFHLPLNPNLVIISRGHIRVFPCFISFTLSELPSYPLLEDHVQASRATTHRL
jgi:hypothetical protein